MFHYLIGTSLTGVTMTAKGYLCSFRLLGEDFLVLDKGENEKVIREADKVIGVSSWYWVIGPSGRLSLVSINAMLFADSVIYLLDHWVEL